MLTNSRIAKLKPKTKQYKISDGEGLFIVVRPNGEKYWRLKFNFAGREKTFSIGRYPEIDLQEARDKKYQARSLLRENKNPIQEKREQKLFAQFVHDHSSKSVATEWFELNQSRWDPKNARKLWRRMEMHVLPHLGIRPTAEIKPLELLNVIRQIEKGGSTETAHCVYGLCNRIFKYAVIIGISEHNPATNLSGGLKPNRHKGYPVIPVGELPEFLRAFSKAEVRQVDRLAFQLLLLTALRTGELRHCRWNNVSMGNGVLKVPAEVMKMREDHIVPLSSQALSILEELRKLTGHQEWLFPNPYKCKHPVISENVINLVIEEMGYKGRMVGHSFRKLFSTVLNENEFPVDAIERQLAHRERNGVRAAYNYAQYLGTRRMLMQWWADYLEYALTMVAGNSRLDLRDLPASRYVSHLHVPGIDPTHNVQLTSAFRPNDRSQHISPPYGAHLN